VAVQGANVGVANTGDYEIAHDVFLPWMITSFNPKTGLL
jgi:hypothetical protein